MSGSDSDSQLSGSVESVNDARGAGKRKAKRVQRRGSFGSATVGVSASSATDRERDRMHSINDAFKCLKDSLPFIPPDTKLSKIRTLRYAISYISHLSWELGIAVDGSEVARRTVDWQYGFTVPSSVSTPYSYYHAHPSSYTNAASRDPRRHHQVHRSFTLQTDFQTLQQQSASMRQIQPNSC